MLLKGVAKGGCPALHLSLVLAVATLGAGCLRAPELPTPPAPEASPTAAQAELAELLGRLCWVAYSPTHYDPTTDPIRWPSEEDVREDLRVLREAEFDGLVTYGSNYRSGAAPERLLDLPALAREAGFTGMIVGVWDPADEDELQTAAGAAANPIVAGYCVGNEGLDERYDLATLVAAMERLRQASGKPVTTTEQVHDYYENSPLWAAGDWAFPNAHPYWSGERDPAGAVAWTERVFAALQAVSDKPLVFKEVGLPSAGDAGLSEARQAEYYRLLRRTAVVFVVFEAFDAYWKHLPPPAGAAAGAWPDPEPHWGVFSSERRPKPAAAYACARP